MIIQPPSRVSPPIDKLLVKVFLAGSIEQGKAANWQQKVSVALDRPNVLICNPRRENWDAGLAQDIRNKQFREQVDWELNYLSKASVKLFYFQPNTLSPITLLELGLMAQKSYHQMIVCCPDGFWRKGNVDIVCKRYGITQVPSLEALIERANSFINLVNIKHFKKKI